MEVSIGLYALIFIFFFLVIPGFVARRFYYHGEFSKQIIWSNNILSNLFSSLFVGILLTLFFIFLINLVTPGGIDIDDSLNKFDSYFIANAAIADKKFTGFTAVVYKKFLPFLSAMYLFSAIIGYFLSKLIIFFDFDTKWKFFRFNNTWHYLFSGRIVKLKRAAGADFSKKKVKYTYLDILVSEKDNGTTLYSGLFANYDLSFTETDKLERIHLYRASRFKKINEEVVNRAIPGDVFTITADRILNINTTYVYYDDTETSNKKFQKLRMILVPLQILLVLSYLFLSVSILFSLNVSQFNLYKLLSNQPFFARLLIVFAINVLSGIFTPFTIDNKAKIVKFNGWKSIFTSLIVGGILVIVIFLFYF